MELILPAGHGSSIRKSPRRFVLENWIRIRSEVRNGGDEEDDDGHCRPERHAWFVAVGHGGQGVK
jgi:hypothetical protein